MGIWLTVLLLFGIGTGLIGRSKGASFGIWFLIGFSLHIFGVVAAILSRPDNRELRRRCDRCDGVVLITTQVCNVCGYDLDFPDQAIVPAAHAVAS